jgi:hypothetical protein
MHLEAMYCKALTVTYGSIESYQTSSNLVPYLPVMVSKDLCFQRLHYQLLN